MGGLVLELSKFVMLSMRTCYRSVSNHPFVVGMLLFFIFLHRSFPFMFSLLFSTSPVLVCTAVLLGTLLSFGQSNIPEFEIENQQDKFTHHDIASLGTCMPGVESVDVDREDKLSVTSKGIGEEGSPRYHRVNGSEVGDDDTCVPLINETENQDPAQSEKRVIEHVRDRNIELENHSYMHEENSGIQGMANDMEGQFEDSNQQYTLLQKVRHQILQVKDNDLSPRESSNARNVDAFLSGYGHYNDEGGEDSDSGSDGAESSSPDASMVDILPMLDELHPLLDLETPQPAHMSHSGSDAASDSSVESDEDIENEGGEVEGNEEAAYNGGDEQQVPENSGKDDESKSAIIWTEDDQKNLMDLGNLEVERNQRLESLIARRRARKSFKLTAEKNLIDLDGVNLPFNVSPISTKRHNPFDFPYDDNIPGSAPSIMLARRNPFDLPYDSNEEKPDLKGDHFEQEFIALHANDAFFRRHESFNYGASSLGGAKQERQDIKWRPVFVPERFISEGTRFQRQSSEVSESKLSSVLDSDSVSSVADLDDRRFSEQDFTTETEVISTVYHTSGLLDPQRHSYEDVYSLETKQADRRDVLHNGHDIELGKSENLEPSSSDNGRLPTLIEQVANELRSNPELVEEDDTSSTSSLSSLSEGDEKISDVGEGKESWKPSGHTNELRSNLQLVEEDDTSSTSSLSSLSERDEKISNVGEGEESWKPSGHIIEEFQILPQHSPEESDVQLMNRTVDQNQFKEPVYDSVPLEAENLISLNSISSDMQAEISAIVTSQASLEMHGPFVYQHSDMHGKGIEKATSCYEDIRGNNSKVEGDASWGNLGNCNQPNLTCSHSEVEVALSGNLEVNAVSSDSSYHHLLSDEQKSEEEKQLSWLDKSMVESCLDDHLEELIIEDNVKEEVDDIKEIDAELLLELDAVGDFSVKQVVGESLHSELLTEEAYAGSSESESEAVQDLPDRENILDGENIIRQRHEEVDVELVMLPIVVDNELEVDVSESTERNSSEMLVVEAPTYLEDIVSSSNQASNGSVNEFPELLDTEGSAELPLEDSPVALGNVGIHELLKSSISNEVSSDILPKVVEDNTLGTIGSSVQETFTVHSSGEQPSEGNIEELSNPNILNSKDGLAEVGTEGVGEIVSSNVVFGAEETITTDALMEQSLGVDVDEQPKPSSSKDVLEEVRAEVVDSMDEIGSSNTESSVQETIITDTKLKEVLESNVAETLEFVSSNREVVQATIPTQVSLDNVSIGELPKSSSSKGVLEEASTEVGDSEEIGSNNTVSGVLETIPTHSASKQVLDSNVAETIEIASSTREEVPETTPTPVSEQNVGADELPKPSNSNDGRAE